MLQSTAPCNLWKSSWFIPKNCYGQQVSGSWSELNKLPLGGKWVLKTNQLLYPMSQPWETAHIFHIRSETETHRLIAPTKVSPSRWFKSLTHGKPKLWVDLAARVLWSVAERDLWKILGKANSAEEPTDSLLPFTPFKEPFTSYQNSKGTDILTTPPTHNQTLSEGQGLNP